MEMKPVNWWLSLLEQALNGLSSGGLFCSFALLQFIVSIFWYFEC